MSTLRRWLPWALLALVIAVVATLFAGEDGGTPLDPDNAEREGTRALVQVLREQGVQVEVQRGLSGLDATDAGPGTTVLLSGTDLLGPESGTALLERVTDAARLVVLVPQVTHRPGEVLGLDVSVHAPTGATLTGACQDPRVREGDEVTAWDVHLEAASGAREVSACFPPTPSHNVGGARAGALLTWPATPDRPETTLVGFPSALTNEHVTDAAHAALGLRLLGGTERLLWVVPAPGDVGEDGSLSLWDVLPRSLTAAVVLLGGAVLALALGQGRRLGPVVTEPLPAVVHASQTTLSRGRLYQQAGDRDHALAALQQATRRRLATRLGLPASTPADVLVPAVADASARPAAEVEHLLTAPHTPDDTALLTTARELRSLEEGLRR